jgi:hypothetical protein
MMATCKADICEREANSKGFCDAHYKRFLTHGDANFGGPLRPRKSTKYTNIQWIKDHADYAGDECLEWPFGKFANGYGQVCVNKVNKVASREMCIAAHGEPISPEYEAAHSCGNGHLGCVNPRHLRWATKIENETDKEIHRAIRGADAVCVVASA